jgi:hypothetical protein
MLKHIVFWKLKDEVDGLDKLAAAVRIKEMLEDLDGKVPGLLSIHVGIDVSKSAQSADIVLLSEFPDQAALDAYQIHPLHEACKAFIGKAASERRVVDFTA